MNFTLNRPDRFPVGTEVEVYSQTAWQPGRTPTGAAVTSATVETTGAAFTDLTEGARYVAYAVVGGSHTYINFTAPTRSERVPNDFDVPNWDAATGKLAWSTPSLRTGLSWWSLRDHAGLHAGDDITYAEALENVTLGQTAIAHAAENNLTLLIDDRFALAGALFPANDSVWQGIGKGVSAITAHPEYRQNGSLINQSEAAGPLTRFQARNFTVDGRWDENIDFSVRFTLTEDFTEGDTTYVGTFSGPEEWPDTGQGLFVAQAGGTTGNSVGTFNYTGKTGTTGAGTLTGVTQVDNSNSHPASLPAGTVFWHRTVVNGGGVRATEFDDLLFEDIDFINFGSYCVGLEGRYYNLAAGTDAVKRDVRFVRCRFMNSHHADGLDCKQVKNITLIDCYGEGNADHDFDVRGGFQKYIGCVGTSEHGGAFRLTGTALQSGSPRASVSSDVPLGTSVVVDLTPLTATAIDDYNIFDGNDDPIEDGDPFTSGIGYLGAEEVAFTIGPGDNQVTLTERGRNGTKETTHSKHTSNLPKYLTPATDPTGITDATIEMSECFAHGSQNGISVIGSDGGRVTANISGGGAFGCTIGLAAIGGFSSRVFVNVNGGHYRDNLQTGVMMKSVQAFSLNGVRAYNNGINNVSSGGLGRDNISVAQCSNGGEIHGVHSVKSNGYGLQLIGDTGYVHIDAGHIDQATNVLGGLVNNSKIGHHSGSAFERDGAMRRVKAATTAELSTFTYDNGTFGGGATLTRSSNGQLGTIDGVTLVVGDRVLVKDQTTAAQNGVYTVVRLGSVSSTWQLRRATGFDNWDQHRGASVHVELGTANADTDFRVVAASTAGTIGTTAINWG